MQCLVTNHVQYESVNKDFVSEEDITALYLMGTMEIENAVVIAGLRAEDTSFDTLGYNKEDGSIIRASKNYTFVSPDQCKRLAL